LNIPTKPYHFVETPEGDQAMTEETLKPRLVAVEEPTPNLEIEAKAPDTKLAKAEVAEEMDRDEVEFRALRHDMPGVTGSSAVGIVSIGVSKIPGKNAFFRTHPDFHPVIALVDNEVGFEKQFFAVTPQMIGPLKSIGITASLHTLYLTMTAQGAIKIIPVRCADADGNQHEYNRTREIGLIQAQKEWKRLYADQENGVYKVHPAPAGRYSDPVWPDLKPAKIVKLAFRDKGRLLDSTEHTLFQRWAGCDKETGK
jgi:hypothetical protein